MVVSWVDPEMNAAVNRVISIAGSARKPISISRRAPRPPNAVPVSIAASAENTRASANTPTSAMMSAAGGEGRAVPSTEKGPAGSHKQPKRTGGARHGQIQPVPVAVLDLQHVARRLVVGPGQPAIHEVERAEHVADRLAESVGRVLHAGGLLGIAAVPGVGEARAAVVEAADEK